MKSEKRKNAGRLIAALVIIVLVVLFFASNLIFLYTDYLWFDALDYDAIFTRRLWTSWGLFAVTLLAVGAFLVLNWSLLPHWVLPNKELRANVRGQELTLSARPLRLAFTISAVVMALLFALSLRGDWMSYLVARESVPFGLKDPLFELDIGFYVFRLPWYRTLLGTGTFLVGLTTVGLALRYGLFGQLRERGAVAHLSGMGAAWILLLSVGRLFDRYALLLSSEGVVFGAGYTDVHARLPLYLIQAALFAVVAALLVINAFVRRWRWMALAGVAWVVVSLLGNVYPAFVQRFRVEPNEFAVERPYIEHNIDFTRRAFRLDEIEEQDYPASGTLVPDDLEVYGDVLRNVRLWDYRPLLRTYAQLQEIRLYYHFNDVDIDRYMIDGELREVMLSARELDVDQLAEQAQTWINRHLIFTHGYGLTLSPVSEVTAEGLPRLIVRDIPPVSEDPGLALTRPEIYFGESTHQYVIVNTTENEFDYPQGDANAYARYEGPAGVPLGGVLRRLLLSMRFNSTQILISPALTDESRILFRRRIIDRARAIAPMLWYDDDPYPVIAEGRIVWLLDAYTWTDRYPYSEPMGEVNYMRNSVKVALDAYTGQVNFYLVDPDDAMAATYARVFPDLFQPVEEMPEVLRDNWRYPETLFVYQSLLYATYHMRDPQVFYNREDVWAIPEELVGTGQTPMEPYYVVLRLPDEEGLEFVLIRPYVPAQKQNMVAWFYADSDGEDYGQLGVFKLGKERLTFGPLQVEARIDQNPEISEQLSLWNQRGSRVLRGNLLVIPISGTFLYIEPLYLEAESGQLPQLKRVLVAYGDRVAMAPTLDTALVQLLTGANVAGEEDDVPSLLPEEDVEALAQRAWEHYVAGEACLEEGDWECYGREQAALEEVLRAMVGEEE